MSQKKKKTLPAGRQASFKKKTAVKSRKKISVIKKPVKKARFVKPKRNKLVKKHVSRPAVNDFPAEMFFKARIKVIGIGGGGGSIVSEIGRSLQKATFVIADTDARALRKKSGIKYFCFGQELTHGLGTGVNVELAKTAAEGAKEKISNIFKDQDIIIFIASLGGGLGSGATQVFAETAKQFGGITFGIFTMPFKFEGKNKQRIALSALRALKQSLNVSLVIPNEKIFKIIGADTPITQAFSIVNKNLAESLESMIDLIYNPGIINIDFADLRAILKGIGNSAFLNVVEESGKNRAEKICARALVNPLLQSNSFQAEKILFNIASSDSLSMFEVEKISRHISEKNPKAKIIFGISKNPKLKNKIKTTILMTGGAVAEEKMEEPEKIKPVLEKPLKKKDVKAQKATLSSDRVPRRMTGQKSAPKKPVKKVKKKPPVPKKKIRQAKEPEQPRQAEPEIIPVIPVFTNLIKTVPARMDITEISSISAKKTIRRSGLEIKKAEELQEKKRADQEKEWEIPAFLRRVKYQK